MGKALPASVDDVLHNEDVATLQRLQAVASQNLDPPARLVILWIRVNAGCEIRRNVFQIFRKNGNEQLWHATKIYFTNYFNSHIGPNFIRLKEVACSLRTLHLACDWHTNDI